MMGSWYLWVVICIFWLFHIVNGGTKGDEADVIIRNILSNYEKAAHPNSERDDGAVVIQIGITPLSISIVSPILFFPFILLKAKHS